MSEAINYVEQIRSSLTSLTHAVMAFTAISAFYGARWIVTLHEGNSRTYNAICLLLLWITGALGLIWIADIIINSIAWIASKP